MFEVTYEPSDGRTFDSAIRRIFKITSDKIQQAEWSILSFDQKLIPGVDVRFRYNCGIGGCHVTFTFHVKPINVRIDRDILNKLVVELVSVDTVIKWREGYPQTYHYMSRNEDYGRDDFFSTIPTPERVFEQLAGNEKDKGTRYYFAEKARSIKNERLAREKYDTIMDTIMDEENGTLDSPHDTSLAQIEALRKGISQW